MVIFRKIGIVLLVSFIFFSHLAYGQLVVDNAPPNNSADLLVNNVLINDPLVNTSNISFTGDVQQIGYFNSVNSNVGIETGIILSTGEIWEAPGPNNSEGEIDLCISSSNSVIENEFDINSNDAANLTFNFIAQGNTLEFNYVFASEEYPEYVGSFNDAFGFFLSGPNPIGPNYNNYNIALLPNGDNVSINNVNDLQNPVLYNSNDNLVPDNEEIQYDGFTDVLTAYADLICGEEYTIQLIIADAVDCAYSSAVFLEAGSFNVNDNSVDASIDLIDNIDDICADDLYYLNGSSNVNNHFWTSSGDGVFDDPNLLNTIYTPGNNDVLDGTVNLTLTAEDNCGDVFSDNLSLSIATPPTADAGFDAEICENDTYILNGSSNAISHLWISSGDGVFNDPNLLNTVYTPGNIDIVNGSVILELTTTNNSTCGEVTDEMILNITPSPIIDAGFDAEICEDEVYSLNGIANNVSSYTWISSGDGVFDNPNLLNTIYNPGNNDIINGSVILSLVGDGNGSCSEVIDGIILNITSSPIIDAGFDAEICEDETYSLNGFATNVDSYVWTSSGDGFFDNSNSLNAVYTPSLADINTGSVILSLTGISNGSCGEVTDNIILNITSSPNSYAGQSVEICEDGVHNLNGVVNNSSSYYWITSGNGFFDDSNSLNSVYTPGLADIINGSVNLSLIAEGNGSCSVASDMITITLNPPPLVDVGPDNVIFEFDNFSTINAITNFSINQYWYTSGDGYFDDQNLLNTNYYPGSQDIELGYVDLSLIAFAGPYCENVQDQMRLYINDTSLIILNSCDSILWGDTVFYSDTIITQFFNLSDGDTSEIFIDPSRIL